MSGPRIDGNTTPPVGIPNSDAPQPRQKATNQSTQAEQEFVRHLPPAEQQTQAAATQTNAEQPPLDDGGDVQDRPWFKHLPIDDQQAILASQNTVLEDVPEPESKYDQIQGELANHPSGQEALDRLVDSPSFQALGEEAQDEILEEFRAAPNAANAQYLDGLSRVRVERTESDFDSGTADLAYYNDQLKPDAGELQIGDQNFTIRNGNLFDDTGEKIGRVRTDGTFRFDGGEAQNYYGDLNARVHLIEDGQVILNLYPADPNGHLEDPGVNPVFRDLSGDVLEAVRRDGNNMQVTDAYRSVSEQDGLYAQGRTTPGDIVTNARGGSSYHNYGLAADVVNLDSVGDVDWSTDGEFADRWQRYGEHVQQQGMEWGGGWNTFVDLPHMEYHPGLSATEASTLLDEYQAGGLPEVWGALGIDSN